MRVLDLCTEFGSETKAFKDRGHEVIMLGIEGDVDIKCDVRSYYPSIDDHYDFIICHPPCQEFSLAMLNPVPCKDRHPDLSVVWACLRIIETLKPPYWMLENPRACLRHFIGKPTVTIMYRDYGFNYPKPTDLWGVFPWFWSETPEGIKKDFRELLGFTPQDKAKRSIVPYGLSMAICKALERECVSTSNDGIEGYPPPFYDHFSIQSKVL